MRKGARMVRVCPSCDTPKYNKRITKTPSFRCCICGEEFEEPSSRASRREQGTQLAPDTPDADEWQALTDALQQTRAAGSKRARSKLIAQYSDELDAKRVGHLLAAFGEGVVVEVYWETSKGTLWKITMGDDPPAASEVTA